MELVVRFRGARGFLEVTPSNLSNPGNLSCNPLLETKDVEGEWIPIVLGINIAAATVSRS